MHNINTYVGRQSAWHKLGTVTGKYQTTEELLRDPGFQYIVFKSQSHDGLGRPIASWGTYRWNIADKLAYSTAKIAGDEAGMRAAMEQSQFLGAVGEDYAVMQHDEGFKTIDAVMRTADGAHYETAGVLGNGERVWALADLGFAVKVGEDVQKGYLLFSTGHDGSMSHSYRLVFTRVVCQNTLGAALSERTKAALTIRHTKNANARLIDARAALASMGDDIVRIEDRLNFLAGKKLNREGLTGIMDRLFPKQVKDDGVERETSRRNGIIADILKIYEMNDGNAFPEQRGTSYNLLNAITNYVDHERSSKGDARAESAMFGSGDTLKSKALEVIMEASKGFEDAPRRLMVSAGTGTTGSSLLDSVAELTASR